MNRISSFTAALFLLFANALWAGEINLKGQGLSIPDGDTSPRTPDCTDFGQLAAGGGTRTHTFVIENTGNSPLLIAGVTEDGAAFSLINAPSGLTLAAGATRSFEVRFNPTSAGIKEATISIGNDDTDEGTYTFLVTGEGLGNPEIDVRGSQNGFGPWATVLDGDTSPRKSDGTDFGIATVGGEVITKTFQIVNTGDGQLTIDSITEGNQNFAIAGVPATVGVNQTQTFTINFDPQSVGIKTTTVTIQNNDANEDPYTFSVTGEGRAPEMKVRGQTHIVINGDTTPSTTNGTDFGQIAAAAAGGVSREFFIHNEGNQDLFVSAILQSSSAFTITDTPNFAAPITPGNSASFTVLFNPTSAGLKTSTVTIRSNDPANDPHTFAIEGEGLGTAEILVQGQLNGTWVEILDGDPSPDTADGTDFANASVGGSGKTRTFRIRNTGDAQLTIDSITDGSPHFSVENAPTVVGVNQTQTFTVTFAPTSSGTKNSTITIRNNDPDEDPYTFNLTGTGRAPDIEVTGQGLMITNGDSTPRTQDGTDFGQIAAEGGSISRTFVIHNGGNNDLNISAILENGGAFSITGGPSLASPILAGATASFDVIFNPTSGGTKSATIQIRSDDPAKDPYTFDVTGEGLGTPEMELRGRKNISSPWFTITKGATSGSSNRGTEFPGTLVNGGISTSTFQIRNIGAAQITIDSITIDSPDYVAASVPATVGVNQTQTFTIAFNPSSVGNEAATVTVLSNDPDDSPFTFALDGLGLADGPKLEVRGGPDVDLLYDVTHEYRGIFGNKAILTIQELQCDHGEGRPINHGDTTPSPLDGTHLGSRYSGTFAPIAPAGSPPPRPATFFRLRNNGDSDLTITGITFTGDDLLFPHNEWAPEILLQSLPPGGCATLPVEFLTPISEGLNTATINITSNDPSRPLFQFDVSIEGLSTSFPAEIEVFGHQGETLQNNSDTVDFGIVTSGGNSNSRTIRIQNSGESLLTLDSIISDHSDFIVTPATEANLSTDEWVDFNITFSPMATGERNGTVTIASNADNEPAFSFNVTGIAQGDQAIEPDPEPELVVFGGTPMVRLLPEDSTPSPTDGTDAGTFEVGDEITYTFRARNRGEVPLNFTQAPFIVGTGIRATGLVPTLDPGEHDDFTVTFTPRNPGDYELRLVLESDAPVSQYSFVIGATVEESPTIENAGIEILGYTLLDGDAYLNFNAPAGSTYRVVTNTTLEGSWNLVEGGIPGGGFYSTFIAGGGESPKRFFRVEKE